ncbi:DUF523 domain-containing protein [Pelagibius sp. Alg239-R121]|uniref:DUF523 domain-containing protein n=1 Tax=Pelagibius sp. Alg239-R121 TaxID=2993448 RepID=UPI0024A76CEE|nr:DUF523 domain-containing protein [Pelagibius sp. Alg239-R121]
MEKILVSACLLGKPVRYDGSDKTVASSILSQWQREGRVVGLCPEVEAGLPVPRPPAEIIGGRGGDAVHDGTAKILENTGKDVTQSFLAGAWKALETARKWHCRFALLTDGSPSCGSSFLYDGSFTGARIPGAGVVAALLLKNGVEVFSEHQISMLAERLDADETPFRTGCLRRF